MVWAQIGNLKGPQGPQGPPGGLGSVGYLSATDFGAVGDGDPAKAAANTDAFIAISDAIEAHDGGELVIPPGTYYVGKQDFAGATGLGYAYRGYHIIEIDKCTKPLAIIAEGVTLKFVSGLRYGSFDPVTGDAMATRQTTAQYQASGKNFFKLYHNYNVTIEGPLELDGNIENFIIGADWGDTGIQIAHDGIEARNNRMFTARDVIAHHCGRDGIHTGDGADVFDANVDDDAILLENCKSLYNGRQGWSIIGGHRMMAINCDFSKTGRNSAVASAPGAGIDIENEAAGTGLRNVTLINCRMKDNVERGLIAASGNTKWVNLYDCEIIQGGSSFAFEPSKAGFRLYNCRVIGNCLNGFQATKKEEALQARGCYFSVHADDFPADVTPVGANNSVNSWLAYYDGCTFVSRATGLVAGFPVDPANYATFNNCNWRIPNSGATHTMRGHFVGRNVIECAGNLDLTNVINRGSLVVNGVEQVPWA